MSRLDIPVKNKMTNSKKILLGVGLLLMALTYAFNEQLGSGFYSVSRTFQVGILIFDALFALVAVFILVQHKSGKKIFLDIGVGLIFTLILLAGMEGAFYFLNSRHQSQLESVEFQFISGGATEQEVKFKGEHAQAFFRRDDWLGYGLVPNTQVKASRKKNQELLYEVVYSTDAQGRRVTPVEGESRPDYILFFGDSYTFGEGVNDEETMPAYIGQFAPRYKPYNYGVGGYGPQQMLAKLQTPAIRAEITEAEGVLVYTFISEHIARAVGSMRIHNQRGEVMPYYFLDDQGMLIRQGTMTSGRPGLASWYSLAGYSQTLLYLNIDFPVKLRPQDLAITAKMLEESRALYREKFGSDRFIVLIYPSLGVPELLPYLQAAGIDYLDYSDFPQMYEKDFWLGEGHPAAKAHSLVAETLAHDLGIAGQVEE